MANADGKQMIVGLDIGTSKVVAVVGEIDPDGGMEVVGIGSHPSRGMKKGVVDSERRPACGGGSGVNGRVSDPLCLRRHRR